MKSRAMKPGDRRAQLVQEVSRRGGASVEELADFFATSRETIRRDLHALAESGQLLRVHGAARPPRPVTEGSFQERMTENAAAKGKIARLALQLLAPGDTIFLDTGSTTLIFAQGLAAYDDLKVITNSVAVADVVSRGNSTAKVFLLGGCYQADNRETFGPQVIAQLSAFYAKRAFLTIAALDGPSGAADINFDEAEVAKAMVARAEELVVLADSSKLDRPAPFTVANLQNISHLVTERCPSHTLLKKLRSSDVEVIYDTTEEFGERPMSAVAQQR